MSKPFRSVIGLCSTRLRAVLTIGTIYIGLWTAFEAIRNAWAGLYTMCLVSVLIPIVQWHDITEEAEWPFNFTGD